MKWLVLVTFIDFYYQVFRHGERNLMTPYPTSLYKNESYWPGGRSALTKVIFQLGSWEYLHTDNNCSSCCVLKKTFQLKTKEWEESALRTGWIFTFAIPKSNRNWLFPIQSVYPKHRPRPKSNECRMHCCWTLSTIKRRSLEWRAKLATDSNSYEVIGRRLSPIFICRMSSIRPAIPATLGFPRGWSLNGKAQAIDRIHGKKFWDDVTKSKWCVGFV